MTIAVVLFSGGLDSTTVVAYAQHGGYEVHALSFEYGQRHSTELDAAIRTAALLGVKQHKIIPLSTDVFSGSALTDKDILLPTMDSHNPHHIPITYVPGRNILFLSYALSYAESVGASDIFMGVSAVDYSGYPDCRPEFFEAFEHMANLGTKRGVERGDMSIHTPLIALTKAQTITLGLSLGVDYSYTVSCYTANEQGEACGLCESCGLRKRGFQEAGVPDVTRYSTKS
jgi:7-cyano-7-deazaguanine synthase